MKCYIRMFFFTELCIMKVKIKTYDFEGSLRRRRKPASMIITSHREKFQSTVCDSKLIMMTVFVQYLSILHAKKGTMATKFHADEAQYIKHSYSMYMCLNYAVSKSSLLCTILCPIHGLSGCALFLVLI